MPVIMLYLLKLSISLSTVWLFYQVLLHRLTFYHLNRWYLLFYSLLSFFIPLIDIAPMVEKNRYVQPLMVRIIPAIVDNTPVAAPIAPLVTSDHAMMPDGWSVLLGVMVLGSIVLLTKLLISWMALRGIRRRSELIGYEGARVYQVNASIVPFSFGNAIFVNRRLHTERELEEILAHERVHIRQKHTVDIVLAELFIILNWFNPFVWLIRRSIRQNLEFIADSQMLNRGYDRKAYQYHLLKVTGQSPYRLANNFNFSSLKKRIVMMNRIQSARVHLLKFLFILPLMSILLVSFRGRVNRLFHGGGLLTVNVAGVVTDDQNLQPLEGVTVRDNTSGLSVVTDARGYYKLQIPMKNGSAKLDLETSKAGYVGSRFGTVLSKSCGLIQLETMHLKDDRRPGMSLTSPYSREVPADPEYADVIAVFKSASQEARDEKAEESRMQFQDDGRPRPPGIISTGVSNGRLYFSSSTGNNGGVPSLLYVIDGIPGKFDPEALTPKAVYSIDQLSTEKSQALYPEKCDKCIAIEITTRQNKDRRAISSWGPYYSKGSLRSDNNKILLYYH